VKRNPTWVLTLIARIRPRVSTLLAALVLPVPLATRSSVPHDHFSPPMTYLVQKAIKVCSQIGRGTVGPVGPVRVRVSYEGQTEVRDTWAGWGDVTRDTFSVFVPRTIFMILSP
jgi:hypothetical protein